MNKTLYINKKLALTELKQDYYLYKTIVQQWPMPNGVQGYTVLRGLASYLLVSRDMSDVREMRERPTVSHRILQLTEDMKNASSCAYVLVRGQNISGKCGFDFVKQEPEASVIRLGANKMRRINVDTYELGCEPFVSLLVRGH